MNTDASTYTDEDVDAVARALFAPERFFVDDEIRAVLDAVAPAIAARALREAASDARRAFLSGKTLGMPSDHWLEERADEIEGRAERADRSKAGATLSRVAETAEEWIEFGGSVMRTDGHVLRGLLRRTGSTEIDRRESIIMQEQVVDEHFDVILRLDELAYGWRSRTDIPPSAVSDLCALIDELDTKGAFGGSSYCDDRLPDGWSCTRADGHDGPCIAREVEPVSGETWPEEYDNQGNLKEANHG